MARGSGIRGLAGMGSSAANAGQGGQGHRSGASAAGDSQVAADRDAQGRKDSLTPTIRPIAIRASPARACAELMPALAREGLTRVAAGAAGPSGAAGRGRRSTWRSTMPTRRSSSAGRGRIDGPVTIVRTESLPTCRTRSRSGCWAATIARAGDEGPVELGKLEALSRRMPDAACTRCRGCEPMPNSRSFAARLAGALVTAGRRQNHRRTGPAAADGPRKQQNRLTTRRYGRRKRR